MKLIDTWIGESGVNYIAAEAERVSESGINIAEACSHTASRPPARRLRRKITTLLPEIDGALKLEFEGATSLTSSFLDELLESLMLNSVTRVSMRKSSFQVCRSSTRTWLITLLVSD